MTIKVTEHAKTCKYSLYDFFGDPQNEDAYPEDWDYSESCSFDEAYDVRRLDQYWSYDFGKRYLSQDFIDNHYGEQTIYNYWVRGTQTW